MTTLLERLQNRGEVISRVCRNIEELRRLDDNILRRVNRVNQSNNVHRLTILLGIRFIYIAWPEEYYSKHSTKSQEFFSETMTRGTFETGLRNVIAYYEKQESLDEGDIKDFAYLKLLLKEHEATPYRNGGSSQ